MKITQTAYGETFEVNVVDNDFDEAGKTLLRLISEYEAKNKAVLLEKDFLASSASGSYTGETVEQRELVIKVINYMLETQLTEAKPAKPKAAEPKAAKAVVPKVKEDNGSGAIPLEIVAQGHVDLDIEPLIEFSPPFDTDEPTAEKDSLLDTIEELDQINDDDAADILAELGL